MYREAGQKLNHIASPIMSSLFEIRENTHT